LLTPPREDLDSSIEIIEVRELTKPSGSETSLVAPSQSTAKANNDEEDLDVIFIDTEDEEVEKQCTGGVNLEKRNESFLKIEKDPNSTEKKVYVKFLKLNILC
jgi:hypothetical protein